MTQMMLQDECEVEESIGGDEEELGKEDQKSRFVHLRAKGLSLAKIAKELEVSKSTLVNWSRELQELIAQTRAVELETLQEEFFLLKEGRIRLLGKQLKAIQAEIGKRDLSKVKTDKLLGLQLRYFTELKDEYTPTSQSTKIGPKLTTAEITSRLQSVLNRYEAGEITETQAKQEQGILQAMLKAIEQTELAAKLERLEAVIKSRR